MKTTTVDKNKVGRGAGANEGGESTIAPHTLNSGEDAKIYVFSNT